MWGSTGDKACKVVLVSMRVGFQNQLTLTVLIETFLCYFEFTISGLNHLSFLVHLDSRCPMINEYNIM